MRLFLQPAYCDPGERGDGQNDEQEQAFGDAARSFIVPVYHDSSPSDASTYDPKAEQCMVKSLRHHAGDQD
ncbi:MULTISPECIES: hypothetical protein [unclassified Sphingomonas]|uniref:hypothetical protein n=1 Tax=unclassified Sphingomonas TaxID=196159 RepID=UPI00226984ED|nr:MULTISPECIES: hypothetical protein [unclassified Sphingomonas]